MINSIIQAFTDQVISLPWVERYGGLVRPAVKTFIDENSGLIYNKTYPISCDVNEKECWEKGRYQDLIPNDKYKSITYFEQRGAITIKETQMTGREMLEFNAPITFVAWLNLPKLGISECSSPVFEASAIKMLMNLKVSELPFQALGVKVIIEASSPKNEGVFTKYSYGDKFGLLLYPFDYFSININIRWYVQPQCLPEYEPMEPICK
jgi:hypothetical protein